MRVLVPWVLLLTLSATPLSAQRPRIIVDSANGPGTHYTDLDPAVAASRPGDVIIVRPGNGSYYTLNRDITHGLRIVAPGPVRPVVTVDRYIRIPLGQLLVIDNITIGGPRPPYGLAPQGCAGTIILSRMDGAIPQARACARIVYTDCRHHFPLGPALVLQNGTKAYVLDSEMIAQYSRANFFFQGGIWVEGDSHVWIVNSRVKGGDPAGASFPEAGLDVASANSRAFVAGRCDFTGGGPVGLVPRAPGILIRNDPRPNQPQPFLVLDPETQSNAPRSTGGYELVHETPVVSPSDAVHGQPQTVDVIGPRNSIVAVFVSLVSGRPPIESDWGDIWLHGAVMMLGAGPVDANRDLRLTTTIPPWMAQGEVLVYQALSLSPQSLFEIGPPGFAVVQ